MTVRFTPRARDDLRDILDYIKQDNAGAADKARRAIAHTIAVLASRPHLGIRNARAPELRSLLVARYPYRIHYLVKDNDVWIVHIRHTARRPWLADAATDTD